MIVDQCDPIGLKDTMAFHHPWTRRRAWYLHKFGLNKLGRSLDLSLLALAVYFCNYDTTDDRDRLYGLTGLCTENHGLEVNYSWTVDEVYLRFAKSFIMHHKSLDIISFASLFVATSSSALPSWVPDFRTGIRPLVVQLMASQSSCSFIGNLRPGHGQLADRGHKLACYSACGSREAEYRFEGSTLFANGFVIDTIDGLASSGNFELVQSSEQHSQCSDAACSPVRHVRSICRSLVLGRKDRYLQYPMPVGQYYRDLLVLCASVTSESATSVYSEFRNWFESTRRLRIHGNSFEEDLMAVLKDAPEISELNFPPQDEYIQDSFYGRFFDVVERMSLRLMTSCNGRIGMASPKAIKGDLICILFGCSIPMILRKVKHKDQYTVVGECFLDEYMEGKAMEQRGKQERSFHIV